MKKKMMKAIKELNAYIDDDRQKLCDELHEIKLSHKRLENLLRRYLLLQRDLKLSLFVDLNAWHKFDSDVKRELSYPYYRVNWKVKGGKDA